MNHFLDLFLRKTLPMASRWKDEKKNTEQHSQNEAVNQERVESAFVINCWNQRNSENNSTNPK